MPSFSTCFTFILILIALSLIDAKVLVMGNQMNTTQNWCHVNSTCYTKGSEMLWMLQRNGPAVFFFGTIHVPYSRVWDGAEDSVKNLFISSDHIFFELDLMDPYTVTSLIRCQYLPGDLRLNQVLPSSLHRRLKRHLRYVRTVLPEWLGINETTVGSSQVDSLFNSITGNWERKRPIWIILLLNSLSKSDLEGRFQLVNVSSAALASHQSAHQISVWSNIPVLDVYLAQEASRLNKATAAIEQVTDQCVPLNGLSSRRVVFALNQTLNEQEEIREGRLSASFTTEDLIRHYKCGDLNPVIFNKDTLQVPMLRDDKNDPRKQALAQEIDSYFRSELISKRNRRMANHILQLIASHPEESLFFAIGAGHFFGDNSILSQIQDAGYELLRLSSQVDTLNGSENAHHAHARDCRNT